jgi:hypothetical protein
MTSTLYDIVQSLIKSYSFILKLFNPLFFPGRNVTDFDLLQSKACHLHHLQHHTSLDPSIGELAVKQHASVVDV